MATEPQGPDHDCQLCPRLVEYRTANRAAHPDWFNGPVPSFGPMDAPIVIIGMAPGVKGANRTGRPFTGDHAGIILYETLIAYGLARGTFDARPDDGLELDGCRIVNAVRCVPPANLPTPAETAICNRFLTQELQQMPNLRVALALGVLAHAAVLRACGIPQSHVRFRHGAVHALPDGLILCDSYHVSRYNTNTGRLTVPMFQEVVRQLIEAAHPTSESVCA
ncbi:uracil-DNA glycosylase [Acidisoma cladoniae]|jgi:uracil-DNA glycosylase family 4|uniref:uracil-DNA glycosylase n=1 Tax=Acidisoma cladoniae TaxID=3040935 RepID=UPI00254C701A|nr:uracil-DNA glycosylase [Acidisoma sp. PAMC 29798]